VLTTGCGGPSTTSVATVTVTTKSAPASPPKVTATISAAGDPQQLGVDPGTNALYVATVTESLSMINLTSRSAASTIPVGKVGVIGLAVDPATHTVYTANIGTDSVSVIDTSTNTVTANIPAGRKPRSVVDSGTQTLYTTNGDDQTVSVINPATRTVTATIPVGIFPDQMAIDSGRHTLYVINYGANTLSVIDLATNTVTSTVQVGAAPTPDNDNPLMGMTVDPVSHSVYIAHGGKSDKNVSVFDPATGTVTNLPVGNGTADVAHQQLSSTPPTTWTIRSRRLTLRLAPSPPISPSGTTPPTSCGISTPEPCMSTTAPTSLTARCR
jgi:serine/threonine-protein kinase